MVGSYRSDNILMEFRIADIVTASLTRLTGEQVVGPVGLEPTTKGL